MKRSIAVYFRGKVRHWTSYRTNITVPPKTDLISTASILWKNGYHCWKCFRGSCILTYGNRRRLAWADWYSRIDKSVKRLKREMLVLTGEINSVFNCEEAILATEKALESWLRTITDADSICSATWCFLQCWTLQRLGIYKRWHMFNN